MVTVGVMMSLEDPQVERERKKEGGGAKQETGRCSGEMCNIYAGCRIDMRWRGEQDTVSWKKPSERARGTQTEEGKAVLVGVEARKQIQREF